MLRGDYACSYAALTFWQPPNCRTRVDRPSNPVILNSQVAWLDALDQQRTGAACRDHSPPQAAVSRRKLCSRLCYSDLHG
jgi:hypothetical protein